MKSVVLLCCCSLILLPLPSSAQVVRASALNRKPAVALNSAAPRWGAGPEFGSVRRVLDADTYEVLLPAGLVRVRLLGVDAPELSQPFGRRAADSVVGLLRGRVLKVERLGVDGYGRTLAGLRVGVALGPLAGPFERRWLRVDSILVARGLAWAYEPGQTAPTLAGLQELARRKRRGLWKCGPTTVVRPGVWRALNKQEKASAWGGCTW
ncbi:thermonuclease family protein [Hymenobacter lapidiphilus]|uniref:Thermonuclease family protein n=1 Tax=Hymenobacter lapidiphilus TaxID=2608003 RepID=A0A7Y7PQY9_9BACT|nr:thermonuclease family protein [Hymenobacter lapidiphilus]NVO32410.1 thermonuclease family protein [Hymenobacter lapidiphilus]